MHHFVAIGEFKLVLQSGNAQSGSNLMIFWACDLEIWRKTLKNNRAPLLSNIKLYVSFHHHLWIQTGVTVWKQLSRVVTSVTLTFDLWPWPFMDITSVIGNHSRKFHDDTMTGTWWKRCHRQTERRTDRRIEPFIELLDRNLNKSEAFDSCDWPSNVTQIGFKSSIFQPVWPWNLIDDLER